MAIAGIDFVKNIMIAAQCYVGTLMEPASAKLLAYTLVGMCLGGIVNLFANPIFPPGSNMPPLPPVISRLCRRSTSTPSSPTRPSPRRSERASDALGAGAARLRGSTEEGYNRRA